MLDGVNNNLSLGKLAGGGTAPATSSGAGAAGAGSSSSTSFADTLKQSIDEVSKLQQDASQAVTDLATGKTDNVSGVMTAMEKSDLAFKTLLAIRAKLMDAYDEVKGMQL
jgi:flagellar hook-basal body complex protein FliE